MSAWKRAQEVRRERTEERKKSRRQRLAISWSVVRADLLGLFVHLMVQSGRAVLLGTTSAGDVLSVSVYDDGDRERYYIRGGADVVGELVDILADYSEGAADELEDAARPREPESDVKPRTTAKAPQKTD